jgi:transcriptional regulator with XRE-family HTH domain
MLPRNYAWHYFVAMDDDHTEAVKRALEASPCSDRALALEAGVPPSTISRIRKGERAATIDVATRIADALGRWAAGCCKAEEVLRQALDKEVKR